MNRTLTRILCLLAWGLLATGAIAAVQTRGIQPPGTQTPKIVSRALDRARDDNTRALLVFGDDGVRAILGKDLARLVLYEYELVELPADHAYGAPMRPEGIEGGFLVLLGPGGQVIARAISRELASTSALEAFLRQHKAEPLDADRILAEGLREAARSRRKAFVHFSAPW